MGDVFLDAFLDTLKVLPFLLLMNFLIELLEYKSNGLKANRILKGGCAPLIGTAVGVVPQCGFSVVATELYCKRRIALGTLFAVYIATSDEALPIMLSSYAGLTKILPVLIIKVCFALIVGYTVFAGEKLYERHKASGAESTKECVAKDDGAHTHDGESETDECVNAHIHGCHRHSLEEEAPTADGSEKKQKAAQIWRVYFKHPLLHTATVALYIFAVNVVLGIAVYYVGQDKLAEFIGSTGYIQPALAALVGLIPNCAASVVITELYIVGGLNLGGTVAGLCVGAGIGYAVLAKQNRPIKNTAAVIVAMYVLSVGLGVCVTACGF